ncbi:MAG: hypothetical protein HWE21_10585, partial [Cytophagia bacterium]|nr:hypothetical protein [Cytophagia bacterium]
VLLFIYGAWHDKKTKEGFYDIPLIVASIVLAVAAQSVVNYSFPPAEEGKNALITLAYHAKKAILHPYELVRWLAAMSMAFGPALWLAINHYRKTNRYDNTRNLLLMYSGLYLAFGILAGGDMTRIIFLGFPFLATWIIFELQEINKSKLLLLGLLSLPLTFIWKTIPDPAWQWEAWESWYPEFASWENVLLVLGYCLVVTLVMKMKNIALISVLLLIALQACAQKSAITSVHIDSENKFGKLINGKPKRDSLLTLFNDHDSKIAQGRFAVDNENNLSEIMSGQWTYFYDNGNIKSKGEYKIAQYIECGIVPFYTFYPYKTGKWQFYTEKGEFDFELNFISKTHHVDTSCEGGADISFGIIENIPLYKLHTLGADYFYELQKIFLEDEYTRTTMTPLNGRVYVTLTMKK